MLGLQSMMARAFRGPTRGSAPRVRSRVPLPAVVDFPQPVLRALRLLDPMLDGYVLPDGRVWILQLVPDRARILEGRKLLLAMKEDHDQWEPAYAASLMAEGFWLLGELPFLEGTSAGAAVRLASKVLNVTQDKLNKTMRARRSEADSSEAAERMRSVLSDRIRSSARSDWARSFRARRTFS